MIWQRACTYWEVFQFGADSHLAVRAMRTIAAATQASNWRKGTEEKFSIKTQQPLLNQAWALCSHQDPLLTRMMSRTSWV